MKLSNFNQFTRRRWPAITSTIVLIALAGFVLNGPRSHKPTDRGPVYEGKDVPAWFDAIQGGNDNDPAIRTLIQIGRPAVPYLVKVASGRPSLRHRVGLFLAKGNPPGWLRDIPTKLGLRVEVIFQCEKAIREEDRRLAAIFILDRMGPPAQEALPALRRLAEDHSSAVRFYALCAICKIGPTQQDLSLFLRALTDDASLCRCKGADGLAELGAKAGSAVPALHKALADSNQEVRSSARRALARVSPNENEH